jgi:hypothetical protein
MYWALPLTVRVAAAQAAVRLMLNFLFFVRLVNFYKSLAALHHIFLAGVLATHIKKLKCILQTFSHIFYLFATRLLIPDAVWWFPAGG